MGFVLADAAFERPASGSGHAAKKQTATLGFCRSPSAFFFSNYSLRAHSTEPPRGFLVNLLVVSSIRLMLKFADEFAARQNMTLHGLHQMLLRDIAR